MSIPLDRLINNYVSQERNLRVRQYHGIETTHCVIQFEAAQTGHLFTRLVCDHDLATTIFLELVTRIAKSGESREKLVEELKHYVRDCYWEHREKTYAVV